MKTDAKPTYCLYDLQHVQSLASIAEKYDGRHRRAGLVILATILLSAWAVFCLASCANPIAWVDDAISTARYNRQNEKYKQHLPYP